MCCRRASEGKHSLGSLQRTFFCWRGWWTCAVMYLQEARAPVQLFTVQHDGLMVSSARRGGLGSMVKTGKTRRCGCRRDAPHCRLVMPNPRQRKCANSHSKGSPGARLAPANEGSTGKTMPRTKSVPLRGGRLARTRQPTTPGWESSRCWWCGEGAATWEAAGGLSIEGFATGSGRLSRGCTQAFSYNAAPTPGDADDEALRELSAAFPLPPGRAALSCTGPPAAKPSPNPGSIQVRPNAD